MREKFPFVSYSLWYYNGITYGLRQARPVSVPTNCIRLNANAQTLLTDEVPTEFVQATFACIAFIYVFRVCMGFFFDYSGVMILFCYGLM
jgi:hypothetical protein